MLISLQIKNIALVEALELNFAQGLTTVTGETGAGKSVILKALSLALGERTDNDMIRHGEDKADVSAMFDISHNDFAKNWLEEQSIDNEDNQCQLRRVVVRAKPSKAYVNGVAVTATALKELSDNLIEIQGQNQFQKVTSSQWQTQTLDTWIKNPKLLDDCQQSYSKIHKFDNDIEELKQQSVTEYEINLLETQIKELKKLEPEEDEYGELDSIQRSYHQGQQSRDNILKATYIIDGSDSDNNSQGLKQLLKDLQMQLAFLPKKNQATPSDEEDKDNSEDAKASDKGEFEQALNDINGILDDVYFSLSKRIESSNIDGKTIDETEKRLSLYFNLARKQRIAPEFLAVRYNELIEKHDKLSNIDAHLSLLEQEKNKEIKVYKVIAQKLHDERSDAAKKLSDDISEEIKQLGLHNGVFTIEVNHNDAIRANGSDKITFMVKINKGSPAKPIDKAASGGELSRIFLATQIVLTKKMSGRTIIYDEIDTGIGGKTAITIGEKLMQLAKNYQVLCITHLAQVAGFGRQQLLVSKQDQGNMTNVMFTVLEGKARVEELARMVSGEITDASLKTAESLIAK